MLLILQIILTIVAWNKGYKWYSLIPILSAFFIGVLIGMTGGDAEVAALIIDSFSIIALVTMIMLTDTWKIKK